MTRYQLLNNVDHKDLRVIQDRSAALGDNLWYVPTFPQEFRNLQRCYPIVFTKNPETGYFQAVALLGFVEGENLFLEEGGWRAPYIPMNVLRQPFLIGFQESSDGGMPARDKVVTVDMESPRISSSEGIAVFLEHGGNSEYLEQVNSILNVIDKGSERNQPFNDMLLGMDLLESFVLDVQLDSGTEHRMSGFYTINEETLKGLAGDDLVMLNNNGFLEPIYMAIASMSNIPELVQRKNRLEAARAAHAEH